MNKTATKKRITLNNILLILLAAVFTLGFFFSFIGIPVLMNKIIAGILHTPSIDHNSTAVDNTLYKTFLEKNRLELIGVIALTVTILLIIAGFVTKKQGFAKAGAIAVFLPVFGQYAVGMFFLTGIGILRVGWLPVIESNPDLLNLGNIIKLPYLLIDYPFSLLDIDTGRPLSIILMLAGSLIFGLGVLNWLQTRYGKKVVATGILYRYSRHPQYLGWLVLSYGLMIYSGGINSLKKSWDYSPGLPWLIMFMTIIGVCMLEELKMSRSKPLVYNKYRDKTPFLLPLPPVINRIAGFPARIITKRKYPESKREVILILFIYTLVLVLFSVPFTSFSPLKSRKHNEAQAISYKELSVDSIITEILAPQDRRNIHKHFNLLESCGQEGQKALFDLLDNKNPVVREFAAISAGRSESVYFVEKLVELTSDTEARVRNESLRALASIGTDTGLIQMIQRLEIDPELAQHPLFYTYLGSTGASTVWDNILPGLESDNWLVRLEATSALWKTDNEKARRYIYESCSDAHFKVRSNAVLILENYSDPETLEVLRKCLYDENTDVRLSARQVINKINSRN